MFLHCIFATQEYVEQLYDPLQQHVTAGPLAAQKHVISEAPAICVHQVPHLFQPFGPATQWKVVVLQ